MLKFMEKHLHEFLPSSGLNPPLHGAAEGCMRAGKSAMTLGLKHFSLILISLSSSHDCIWSIYKDIVLSY